jgi:hypothetical protein
MYSSTTTSNNTSQIVVKAAFGPDDLRQLRIPRTTTFAILKGALAEVVGADQAAVSISWTDCDGDTIAVKTDADWAEAIQERDNARHGQTVKVRLDVAVAVNPIAPTPTEAAASWALEEVPTPLEEVPTPATPIHDFVVVPTPLAPLKRVDVAATINDSFPEATATATTSGSASTSAAVVDVMATAATLAKAPQPTTASVTKEKRTEGDLAAMRAELESTDAAVATAAAKDIRSLVAKDTHPSIQDVIDAGCIPPLVAALRRDDAPSLQFEAEWALTNVASGTTSQTAAVVDAGAIRELVRLLRATSTDVVEQAVWALGNIAGDGPMFRDQVLAAEALTPILQILAPHGVGDARPLSLRRNAVWTLSNLCRGKSPAPEFAMVRDALFVLPTLIDPAAHRQEDMEVLADALWALSYLSDGTNDKIETVLRSGVAQSLVPLLAHPSSTVVTPALRTLGNLVTGDDAQTQQVLDGGVLQAMFRLATGSKTWANATMRKELAWAISNVAAGTSAQIEALVNAGLVPVLVELLQDADKKVRKEAAWAVANLACGGSTASVARAMELGVFQPFAALLSAEESASDDTKVLKMKLDGVKHLFAKMEQTSVEDSFYLLPNLLRLEAHSDGSVAASAVQLLQTQAARCEADAIHGGADAGPRTDPVSARTKPQFTCNADTDLAELVEEVAGFLAVASPGAEASTLSFGEEVERHDQVDEQVDEHDEKVDVATVYPFQAQLDSLVAMGFEGAVLRDLLEEHSGSVAAVVNAAIGA